MSDIGDIKSKVELDISGYRTSVQKIKQESQTLKKEAGEVKKSFEGIETALTAIGGGVAFAGISSVIKATVDEANKLHMSMQGLIEVTKSLGGNVDEVTKATQDLSSKGFMSVTESAEALKTSLAMGLGLEESIKLINTLGDAAAYNRESHLGWGEAVVNAIRGIKMGESTLTDSAGITTNLSVMYERYAQQIGTTAGKLTDAQKIQAAYNGMLEESEMFAGNASSAMDGYSGSVARYTSSMSTLKAEVGEAFMPIIADVLEQITPMIIELAEWSSENEKVVVTIGGVALGVTGLISLLTAGAFAFNTIRTAAIGFQLSLGPIGWALAGISLAATGLTIAYSKMGDETRQAKEQMELYNQTVDKSTTDAVNLAVEYDVLSERLKTLKDDTEEAKSAKQRMSDIMKELNRISPNLINQYDSQAGAITNVANSFSVARKEAIEYAKALLQAKIGSANIRLGNVQEDLMTNDDVFPWKRRELAGQQTDIQAEIKNYEKQLSAVNKIESSYKKAQENAYKTTSTKTKTSNSTGSSTKSKTGKSSSSSSSQKSTEDIAKEQYQDSLRWVQYKKNLNELSLKDELSAYERLLNRYSKYNDIKMEMEENIYRTKELMTQDSFEHSEEWIGKEEQRMRLSGKTEEEVTQLKLDAWQRVRDRYEKDSDYYKRADQELYNAKIQLLRQEEQELKELDQDREDAYKEVKRKILDTLKQAETNELKSIRDRKDAELDALEEREQAELDSLDRRKQAINDYYSEQVENIEDEKTAEDKKAIIDDIEKYKYATSKEGRETYNDLLAQLREIERKEEKDALDKEKRDKLRALEEEEKSVKNSYDSRENKIVSHYDEIYNSTQNHFSSLIDEVNNYSGSVEGLERLLADSRISLNANANSQILSQIRSFVDDYNSEMSRINSASSSIREKVNESINKSNPPSNSSPSNNSSGSTKKEFTGWSTYDGSIKYSVDKNGYIFKNGNFVPAENYKYIPQEVIDKASNVKKGIYHTGGIAGIENFANPNRLAPDEIMSILRKNEIITTPQQASDLVKAGGQTINNNYNAPLVEHNGDVKLEDQADIKTYWGERDTLAQKLLRAGERL